MKPTLRIDALYDVQTALYNAIHALDQPLYKSCLNCIKFNEKAELCNLYNQRPPARVIAYSCGDKWEDVKEIPF
jgi:hypothetical protein